MIKKLSSAVEKAAAWKLPKLLFFILLLSLAGSLTFSCKKGQKENAADSQLQTEVEEESEDQEDYSEYSFYSPATDNASWVEEALARIEEERIAEELRAMEESFSDYEEDDLEYEEENQSSEEELNEETSPEEGLEDSEAAEADTESEEKKEEEISEVEKFFQEEKKGQIKTEKNDYLKFFEFDDETFSQQRVNGKLILIHSSRNSVTRNFYNENYLLEKRESWNIGSAENASLQKTERFEYYKDSSLISSKKITEKDFTERVSYNAQGKPVKSERYAIAEDKERIVSKRNISYNSEGKILSDELTDYVYKGKDYSELDYSFVKKYTYSYNGDEIPPDFLYYENGVLKMQNKYSTTKGTYTSRIYFDDDFSVKTYYENELRVKDTYYSGNKILREKLYEERE